MFIDAFQYRDDSKLFSIRRLQAKTKVQREMMDEFSMLVTRQNASVEQNMQEGMDRE